MRSLHAHETNLCISFIPHEETCLKIVADVQKHFLGENQLMCAFMFSFVLYLVLNTSK